MFPRIDETLSYAIIRASGGHVLRTNRILHIMSINANRLRTKIKRDLLGKLLIDLQVGVGLIAETHLRTADLSWIKYPQYKTADTGNWGTLRHSYPWAHPPKG